MRWSKWWKVKFRRASDSSIWLIHFVFWICSFVNVRVLNFVIIKLIFEYSLLRMDLVCEILSNGSLDIMLWTKSHLLFNPFPLLVCNFLPGQCDNRLDLCCLWSSTDEGHLYINQILPNWIHFIQRDRSYQAVSSHLWFYFLRVSIISSLNKHRFCGRSQIGQLKWCS